MPIDSNRFESTAGGGGGSESDTDGEGRREFREADTAGAGEGGGGDDTGAPEDVDESTDPDTGDSTSRKLKDDADSDPMREQTERDPDPRREQRQEVTREGQQAEPEPDVSDDGGVSDSGRISEDPSAPMDRSTTDPAADVDGGGAGDTPRVEVSPASERERDRGGRSSATTPTRRGRRREFRESDPATGPLDAGETAEPRGDDGPDLPADEGVPEREGVGLSDEQARDRARQFLDEEGLADEFGTGDVVFRVRDASEGSFVVTLREEAVEREVAEDVLADAPDRFDRSDVEISREDGQVVGRLSEEAVAEFREDQRREARIDIGRFGAAQEEAVSTRSTRDEIARRREQIRSAVSRFGAEQEQAFRDASEQQAARLRSAISRFGARQEQAVREADEQRDARVRATIGRFGAEQEASVRTDVFSGLVEQGEELTGLDVPGRGSFISDVAAAERDVGEGVTGAPAFTVEGVPLVPSPASASALVGGGTAGSLVEGATGFAAVEGVQRSIEARNILGAGEDVGPGPTREDELFRDLGVSSAAATVVASGSRGFATGGLPGGVAGAAGGVLATQVDVDEDLPTGTPPELEVPEGREPVQQSEIDAPSSREPVIESEFNAPEGREPVIESELDAPERPATSPFDPELGEPEEPAGGFAGEFPTLSLDQQGQQVQRNTPEEELEEELRRFERGMAIRRAEERAEESFIERQVEGRREPTNEPRTVTRREGRAVTQQPSRTVSSGPDVTRSGPTEAQLDAFRGRTRGERERAEAAQEPSVTAEVEGPDRGEGVSEIEAEADAGIFDQASSPEVVTDPLATGVLGPQTGIDPTPLGATDRREVSMASSLSRTDVGLGARADSLATPASAVDVLGGLQTDQQQLDEPASALRSDPLLDQSTVDPDLSQGLRFSDPFESSNPTATPTDFGNPFEPANPTASPSGFGTPFEPTTQRTRSPVGTGAPPSDPMGGPSDLDLELDEGEDDDQRGLLSGRVRRIDRDLINPISGE